MTLWNNLTGVLASGAVMIVSVFLVIGGVVIMNVMLASVTERTREIGVRKSMGARKKDILMQFLVEISVMSAVGGLSGSCSPGLSRSLSMPHSGYDAVPLGAVVTASSFPRRSACSSVFTRRKAARLDPIEALRFEA